MKNFCGNSLALVAWDYCPAVKEGKRSILSMLKEQLEILMWESCFSGGYFISQIWQRAVRNIYWLLPV